MSRTDPAGTARSKDNELPADAFPLSPAQRSIWLAQRLTPEIPVNIALYVEVVGPLDLDALDRATTKFVGREMGSPYLRIIRQSAETMLRAASELGFSPAARPRLAQGQAAKDPEDDPWTQLRLVQGGKGATG